MQTCTLAVDIGASSGRHIAGTVQNGKITLQEVYRFENGVHRENGHLCWDIDTLAKEVVNGLKAANDAGFAPATIGIDTWAVDFVLLDADNKRIGDAVAYRDERTQAVINEVHQHMPFAELYRRTGIQFQPFNSIYQLYEDAKTGRLQQADDFLMVPEYLLYRLCGVKAREYTNATSTGLVSAATKEYDPEILRALSLPERLFPRLTQPGTVLGQLTPDVAREVGGQTSVVLCATHDTASAVEGIPMAENAPFLSSGTWSLLGAKIPAPITTPESMACNFTNEGGVGYIRYLKNIMGLWIVQCIQKQLGISFAEMVNLARTSHYEQIFNVNDPRFSAPEDMAAEIRAALSPAPETDADLIRSVYVSLAYSYGEAIRELERLTGQTWEKLYIAGGGAKNALLNELTAQYTGKEVVALPIEATALGNLKIQREIR